MTTEQVHKIALDIALRFHLADFNFDKPEEAYDRVGRNLLDSEDEEDIIVLWEPFEYWDGESVANSIWNLTNDILTSFEEALGIVQPVEG